MVLGVVGEIEKYNGTTPLVRPGWVAELPGTRAAFAVGLALVVAAAFAGLGALVLRFRSSTHEERQPLRLLVVMIAAMGIASTLALVTALGSQGAEWSWIAIVLAALVDGFGILIGIPVATGAAVLTYGLYDVGVVMKKTVVYVVLVIFFVILLGLLSLLLLPFAFLGSSGAIPPERELVIARIATAVAVVALVLVFMFRPVKRLARRLVYGRRATRYEAMAEVLRPTRGRVLDRGRPASDGRDRPCLDRRRRRAGLAACRRRDPARSLVAAQRPDGACAGRASPVPRAPHLPGTRPR
jgi:hypothetical protein